MERFYSLVAFVIAFVGINVTFSRADKLPAKHGNGVIIDHVVYPNGKPAAGIRVVAVLERPYIWELTQRGFFQNKPEARQFFANQQNLSAISQADGSFCIHGLITGPYDLLVTGAPDNTTWGQPTGWTALAAVGVWGKQDQTVRRSQNIVLTRGIEIQGSVIDSNGKPLSGIRIASIGPHRPESSDSAASEFTDAKGEYSMLVPPGEITIYIAGPSKIFPESGGTLRSH
jgi:hypothetical protein